MASSSASGGRERGDQSTHQNNLQRIALKKQQNKSWPRTRKLEKLAIYSSCKADENVCKCNGWKNPNSSASLPSQSQQNHQSSSTLNDQICRSCGHLLSAHVCHL